VHGFDGPVVGIVGDAAGFVGFDALAFDEPIEGRFAVDDVVVGGGGDVFDGDFGVVDDGAAVVDGFAVLFLFGVFHFDYAVVVGGLGFAIEGGRVHGHGFVVGVEEKILGIIDNI